MASEGPKSDLDNLDVQGGVEKVENVEALDSLRDLNEGLNLDVMSLVSHREAQDAVAEKPAISNYPIQSRFQKVREVLKDYPGFDGDMRTAKVPGNVKGDFSMIMPSLQLAQDGEDRRAAMTRYRSVDLPAICDLLNNAIDGMKFSVVGIYLNVALDRGVFAKDVFDSLDSLGDDFGNSDVNHGKKVVVDYSSPNTAKTMHVGHLRSTVIGEILSRLMTSTGSIVYGVNHIGDWGTQFGQLVVAYDLWADEVKNEVDPDKEPVKYLAALYRRIKGAIKEEELRGETTLADRGRAMFSSLESGDSRVVALWEEFRRLSLIEFNQMYERLGIKGLDLVLGESFYEGKMDDVVEAAENSGVVEEDPVSGAKLLKFNTPVSLEDAAAVGLVEHSEATGETTLSPDRVVFKNLNVLNEGKIDTGVDLDFYWKVNVADAKKMGIRVDKNRGKVSLKARGSVGLSTALAEDLLELSPVGDRKNGGDKRKAVNLDVAKKAGVVREDEKGTQLLIEDLPTCIFKTSDGRSVYITRDVSAVRHRVNTFNATDIFYVVGNEQNLHMAQLFELSERIGDLEGCKPEHVSFGMMKGKGGKKIASRDGAGGLSEVIDDLVDAAKQVMGERASEGGVDEKELNEIAETIAIGSLIFANVAQEITRDIPFDMEAMMNLDGQTGPYLQYTCVRIATLIEKYGAGLDLSQVSDLEPNEDEYGVFKMIADFPRVIESAANKRAPHILAEYLLKLSGDFNKLYTVGPKIKDLDDAEKAYYIKLYTAINRVLRKGLYLLNIDVPSKM